MAEAAIRVPLEKIAPDAIRLERLLDAPVEKVWRYLTEAELRSQWFMGGTDARPNSDFQLHVDHGAREVRGRLRHAVVSVHDRIRAYAVGERRVERDVRAEALQSGDDGLDLGVHASDGVAGSFGAAFDDQVEGRAVGRDLRGANGRHADDTVASCLGDERQR